MNRRMRPTDARLPVGTRCLIYLPNAAADGEEVTITSAYGPTRVNGQLRHGYTILRDGEKQPYFVPAGMLIAKADSKSRSYSHLRVVVDNTRRAA